MNGSLLHKSVARENASAVAVIATGLAIWLEEMAIKWDDTCQFLGFDVSSTNSPGNIKYVVHIVTNRFPEKYHKRFDTVHIRFVAYALQAQDVR